MGFRRSATLWLALLSLAALVPVRAHAHGTLRRSQPAAGDTLRVVPRELRLEFTEAPELAVSVLRLLDPSGREVTLSRLRTAPDSNRILLAGIPAIQTPGRYTVHWQVAGADGHPVRGEIHFVIADGAAGLAPPPESAAVDRASLHPAAHDP